MTPEVTIFLRTYARDAPLVVELMRSYDRWVSGFRELVVHCDPQDVEIFRPIIGSRGRIVSSQPWCASGYINQQVVKLHCDLWVKSPYTMFFDSDYIACDTCTPERFFVDGKPDLLMTPYADLEGTVPWQDAVQKIMGEPVEYEFMRGPRLCHVTDLFPGLRTFLIGKYKTPDIGRWFCQFTGLSEFNLAGAFAYKVAKFRYHWRDTTKMPLPANPIFQYWSNGGITPDIRLRIESALA